MRAARQNLTLLNWLRYSHSSVGLRPRLPHAQSWIGGTSYRSRRVNLKGSNVQKRCYNSSICGGWQKDDPIYSDLIGEGIEQLSESPMGYSKPSM